MKKKDPEKILDELIDEALHEEAERKVLGAAIENPTDLSLKGILRPADMPAFVDLNEFTQAYLMPEGVPFELKRNGQDNASCPTCLHYNALLFEKQLYRPDDEADDGESDEVIGFLLICRDCKQEVRMGRPAIELSNTEPRSDVRIEYDNDKPAADVVKSNAEEPIQSIRDRLWGGWGPQSEVHNHAHQSERDIARRKQVGQCHNKWRGREVYLYRYSHDEVISVGVAFNGSIVVIAIENRASHSLALDAWPETYVYE